MTATAWVTAWMAAAAVLVALEPAHGPPIRGAPAGIAASNGRPQRRRSWLTSRFGRGLGGATCGLAVLLLIGGVLGLAAGALVGVVATQALGRLHTRGDLRRREQLADLLPLAGELLAAALTSGADPGSALRAVGTAVGDPLGACLEQVARAMDLGSSPEDAWAELMADPVTAVLARPMVRAAASGAPSARTLARMSDELRRQAGARAAHRAEVVGVRAVGPLGLCFLPAFVVLGVVPFVAGSVRHLVAG